MTQNKPLINELDAMGKDDLADELLAIAYNIEQALLQAGAIPKVDYSYLDLFKLAEPYTLELFRTRNMEYAYPAKRVLPPIS
jgi:hypothetical protein